MDYLVPTAVSRKETIRKEKFGVYNKTVDSSRKLLNELSFREHLDFATH